MRIICLGHEPKTDLIDVPRVRILKKLLINPEKKLAEHTNKITRNSRVPSLRNCSLRNSGLILLNKIPDSFSISFTLVHSNILWHIFKKLSVLAQTISFLHNCAYYVINIFSTILTAVWHIKVLLIPWYTHCFEEVYLDIRNQSGCFCERSFLTAGLYCMISPVFA